MKKRKFIKATSAVVLGSAIAPIMACKSEANPKVEVASVATKALAASFALPELGYAFDALEPNIDARTMEIHHGKHHAGYVRKLNAALEGSDMAGGTILEILNNLGPDDTGIRNNGGGHYNHTLFWSSMSPAGGGAPSGDLGDAINGAFDSFNTFKEQFSKAAGTRFGSYMGRHYLVSMCGSMHTTSIIKIKEVIISPTFLMS